ncbi:MAG: YbaB/EbfC family nucleoid-associated protein [Candidatus Eremiobacteraeota bacterium]|nr:YbaB/EbfC family nucleoid-associated protein [Candidatus Eremiobacteraeota bacterium]
MQRQMLKKMQKQLQKSMAKMQEDLTAQVVEGDAGGGMVKVQMNGQQELLSIKIDPSVVDPEEVDMLEDLVTVAFRDAMAKIQTQQTDMMSKITGGLPIPPGLFG